MRALRSAGAWCPCFDCQMRMCVCQSNLDELCSFSTESRMVVYLPPVVDTVSAFTEAAIFDAAAGAAPAVEVLYDVLSWQFNHRSGRIIKPSSPVPATADEVSRCPPLRTQTRQSQTHTGHHCCHISRMPMRSQTDRTLSSGARASPSFEVLVELVVLAARYAWVVDARIPMEQR